MKFWCPWILRNVASQHLLQLIFSQGTIQNIRVQVPTFRITNLTLWGGSEPYKFLKAFWMVPKCSRCLSLVNKRVKLWGLHVWNVQGYADNTYVKMKTSDMGTHAWLKGAMENFLSLWVTMTESTMGQKMENHEKRLYNHEQRGNKYALIGSLSVAVIKKNTLKKKASQRRKSVFWLTAQAGWHSGGEGRASGVWCQSVSEKAGESHFIPTQEWRVHVSSTCRE